MTLAIRDAVAVLLAPFRHYHAIIYFRYAITCCRLLAADARLISASADFAR